jgi:hypothetical protein
MAWPPRAPNLKWMSIDAGKPPYYLAEWYRPRLSADRLEDTATRLEAGVAAMRSAGSDVRLLMTLALPTDEVLFALFTASAAQNVSDACHHAGIPVERLTYALGARADGATYR